METRKACVAGYFYPETKKEIENLLEKICKKEKINFDYAKKNIIGGVVPHAGYIYSAPEAIHFFEILKKSELHFDTIVIINPNHTGLGHDISLSSYKYWDTPYGKVEVDTEFQKLLKFPTDDFAHIKEHSGEVMLPLLKHYLDYTFKIVPICFKSQNYSYANIIAKSIYEAFKLTNRKILIIASSDFSHYIDANLGKTLDTLALEEICNFKAQAFERLIYEKDLSICGYGPIMVLMEYAKLISKNPKTVVLRRGSSGEITGDYSSVVDYNSILFYDE